MSTTFILGGRRSGKTTLAFNKAIERKEALGCRVVVIYPNTSMAKTYHKRYPAFGHYSIKGFLESAHGLSYGFDTFFVLEEINLMNGYALEGLARALMNYDTIYTASPKLYNLDNKPTWVKVYEQADEVITLPDVNPNVGLDYDNPELYSVMAGYRITDIQLPSELAHLKQQIIDGLNKNAPND